MSLKASIRGTMPSLMPALMSEEADSQKKFKAKIKLGTKRVGKWEKKGFRNPARVDGVTFFHWQKAKRLEEAYKFSKFNRKLEIPQYNDAEYETHFASNGWTRKETDYLFEMCRTWDLRFIVIVDKWNPPAGSIKQKRTVEEIKDRYYTIQRGLLPLRKQSEEDGAVSPLLQHVYDPLREAERKRQEDQQTNRTPEEMALESEITSECARIDATFKKHSEDALKYLRLIKKQQKYYANLKLERQAYQAAKDLDERAKASRRPPGSTSPAPTSSSAMDVDDPSATTSGAPLSALGHSKLTRRHPAAFSRVHAKSYTTSLVPLLNQQKYTSLYSKAMPELGVESVPRSGFIIIAAVTELRCDLLLLHEMQKLCAEKTYEIEVLKTLQKTLQDRLKAPPQSSSSSAARAVPSSSMDVDN